MDIGIDVDPNNLTYTLPAKAKSNLLLQVEDFCAIPQGVRGAHFTLWKWQCLAGWLNWSFNVFPLLRPCLNNFYPIISGKDKLNAKIWVNNIIRDDLYWATQHIRNSTGVYLLRSIDFDQHEVNVVIYCDACLEGMGFWYLFILEPTAYYSSIPLGVPSQFISYYEALCVLSTLLHGSHILPSPSQILIYTDNTNTINIFHTLRALPVYNFILRSAVNILLDTDHQL